MPVNIGRRELIAALGSAATWPLTARAQEGGAMRRVGILLPATADDAEYQTWIGAFLQGLQQSGWTIGRNLRIDTRWAGANVESMQRFAKEFVGLQPDLVLTSSTPATAAMLQQTRTIPIIFVWVADPVGSGFVASLPRPGGNVTGFTPIEGSLGGKWVELLREISPHVARTALLFNPATAPFFEYYVKSFNDAAASFGLEAVRAPVHDMSELESVVTALARVPNGGLIVLNEDFTIAHRVEIISLATRYRLPAVYPYRFFAELGGLLSYGVDLSDNFRRAAPYADRILKGEKPADLPVQAQAKYVLTINLKTAKALGLDVPWFLQQSADEVIE
jgi:putative ABC transport system substrate-binding protein